MPEVLHNPGRDPVFQFSVFTENKLGRLFELTRIFSAENVHIMAISTLDTTDNTILRLIVDDPARARSCLRKHHFYFTENKMLVVEISGEADLKGILAALLEAEINIYYLYAFIMRPRDKSALALDLEDHEIASQTLIHHGYKVLTQGDISR